MADLSCLEDTSTLGVMDKAMEGRPVKGRRYLGMSEIGDTCTRRLWLKYHTDFAEVIPARVARLFRMGHTMEKLIIKDLKQAGFKVSAKQGRFKDWKGKFKGHCDGIAEGLPESSKPHILEIKSCNGKSFELFKKHGVKDHPSVGAKYWGQIQCYMGYAGLDRGLFIVENKDTSARYMERVKFEPEAFRLLKEKARLIIEAKEPPRGISNRPDWFECRFCGLNNESHCRKDWSVKGVPF